MKSLKKAFNTLIALIPKKSRAEEIKDFRPISLIGRVLDYFQTNH